MKGGKWSGGRIAAGAGLAVVLASALHILAPGTTVGPPAAAPGASRPRPEAGPRPGPEAEDPALLEIGRGDWTWERSEGEAVVAGEVRNVSGLTLRNLVAEVSFYDGDGAFITSAEAFIFPSVVEPGQTVRFEIREPWNPAMKDAKVSFQELYGYPVKTRVMEP